jgi:hypothetical protein
MRFFLAIRCFFAVLFRRRLPPQVLALGLVPEADKQLHEPRSIEVTKVTREEAPGEARTAPPAEGGAAPPAPPLIDTAEVARQGALHLLNLLQREGRLVDFLQEKLDGYNDAQIGAAVRDIHKGCRDALSNYLPLEPVMPGQENATVQIDAGFDPARVRLVGNVTGQPPFKGVLKHHGWRTREVKLPPLPEKVDLRVVAPAEVELP